MTPRVAMVLAAGLATRMRPLTDRTAKPLLVLRGRTLLDHALDRLADAGVERAVVNAHWCGGKVAEHLARRPGPPAVTVLHEDELLDTGGAVTAALPLLGPDPFYVVNGDAFWLDGYAPALRRLADAWDDDVDAVLLMHRSFQVHAEVGYGDFALDPWGRARRRKEREVVPYIFAGVQVAAPDLLAGAPAGPFSLNRCWDHAMARGRLRGVAHDGLWFHLSVPADLADAEAALTARALGEAR